MQRCDRKQHFWLHPRCLNVDSGQPRAGKPTEEGPNPSYPGLILLFGGGNALECSVAVSVVLLCSNSQLTFQTRPADGTRT